MALGGIYLRFPWQAWRLALGWLWWRVGPDWSPVTPRHFAWQAWHLATHPFVLRDRRGTWRPSFCVAGVALMALGWLRWRAWTGLVAGDAAALCLAGHLATYPFVLRDRRGTWRRIPSFYFVLCGRRRTYGIRLAPVARLEDWSPVTPQRFAWQARHLATYPFVLRDRRGTWRRIPSYFAWQAWHLWH